MSPEKSSEYLPTYSPEELEWLLERFGLNPEEARQKLEEMGYDQETLAIIKQGWEEYPEETKVGSHEIRAIIKIADGSERQLPQLLEMQLRINDGFVPYHGFHPPYHNLYAQHLAERA